MEYVDGNTESRTFTATSLGVQYLGPRIKTKQKHEEKGGMG